jgi:hypothetical protein
VLKFQGKKNGYSLVIASLPTDFEVFMCNCYSDGVKERMGEDYFFWTITKECERTYLKYIVNSNFPRFVPKLEDVR